MDSPIDWDELFENKDIRYDILRQLINIFSKISQHPPVTLENEEHCNLFSNINTWLQNVKGLYGQPHEYELLTWLNEKSKKSSEMDLTEILKQAIEEKGNPNQSYRHESPEIIGQIMGVGFYLLIFWIAIYCTHGSDHPIFYPLTGLILGLTFFCIALVYGEHRYLDSQNNKKQ